MFLVNEWDLMDKWTKGMYGSAGHRIVNVSETDRYSVPFFYHRDLRTKLYLWMGVLVIGLKERLWRNILRDGLGRLLRLDC